MNTHILGMISSQCKHLQSTSQDVFLSGHAFCIFGKQKSERPAFKACLKCSTFQSLKQNSCIVVSNIMLTLREDTEGVDNQDYGSRVLHFWAVDRLRWTQTQRGRHIFYLSLWPMPRRKFPIDHVTGSSAEVFQDDLINLLNTVKATVVKLHANTHKPAKRPEQIKLLTEQDNSCSR